MKKLILVLAVLALTGCSTRQMGPALVGGVIGYAIAKDAEPKTVVIRQPVIVHSAPVSNGRAEFSHCLGYPLGRDRDACNRGAMDKASDDAYRYGRSR